MVLTTKVPKFQGFLEEQTKISSNCLDFPPKFVYVYDANTFMKVESRSMALAPESNIESVETE